MCIPYRLLIAALIAHAVLFASCRKPGTSAETDYTNGILFPFRLDNAVPSESFHAASLIVDSKENKWITFRNDAGNPGIIRFDGNRGDSYPNDETPLPLHSGGIVTAQTEDATGAVYFTSNEGNYSDFRLIRYRDGNWSTWDVKGIPCREIYFNRYDGRLYFVFLNNLHAILPSADFSKPENYQKVNLESIGSPAFIHSAFDGANIHLISPDRYIVYDSTGYALFYTPAFNDLLLSYIYTANRDVVYTIGGSDRDQIYKMHEGRWARFPEASANLISLVVDREENIFVTVVSPAFHIGRYSDGSIDFYFYGNDKKPLASEAPIAIDRQNVKWVVVPEGIVRLP